MLCETSIRWPAIWLLGPLLAALTGCQPTNQYKPPPPPKVTVAYPVQQTVTNYIDATGTPEAVAKVEVRARVKGFLEQVNFEPGTEVKKGDLLYVIEQRQYKANVAAAAADVAAKKVALEKAKIEYDRQLKMREGDATSETNVVAAKAEQDGAAAAIDAANAALDQANRDLGYTQIHAPIDGRVGKTLVKVGNLVGDGEATHLTTVIVYDPIYANFTISERAFLEIQAAAPRNRKKDVKKEDIRIDLGRPAIDDGFPYQGNFDYADLTLEETTGTYAVRGIFANPNRDIAPGMFVVVRVAIGTIQDAILVPEVAVGADQKGRYLLVVNDQNEVERRDVTLGRKVGPLIVVLTGIDVSESVIVDGVQRVRQGSKVTAERTTLAPPAADPSAPQSNPAAGDGKPPAADGAADDAAAPTGTQSPPDAELVPVPATADGKETNPAAANQPQ